MSILNNASAKRVFIGLGGNVGDVIASMVSALTRLNDSQDIQLVAKSSVYKTAPWGDLDQDDFVNSCVELKTVLGPMQLLHSLKAEEARLKRVSTRRWGPRTIDLDILIFDGIEISGNALEIPHPRMTERAFVLMPLSDLAPDEMINDLSISQWLEKCDLDGIEKLDDQKGWISGPTTKATD